MIDEILTNFKLAVQNKGGYGYEETKDRLYTLLKDGKQTLFHSKGIKVEGIPLEYLDNLFERSK